VPLAIRLTGANRNDSQEALALVDAFRHSRVNVDGHDIGQIAWLATAATMRRAFDAGYERVAFCHCWRCVARHNGSGLTVSVGCRTDVRMAESVPPSPRPVR